MKLSEKIIALRKAKDMSQDELAEQLKVSRQAVSRWETGAAMPDAMNILQLSRLFGVTADYLLNDDYRSDDDIPKIKDAKADGFSQIMFFLIVLEVMILIIQFMCAVILKSAVFSLLSFVLFGAVIAGFEYAYVKRGGRKNPNVERFRSRFYKISAWLGTYFPIRLFTIALLHLYPRPYSVLVQECITVVLYLMVSMLICLEIEKRHLPKE